MLAGVRQITYGLAMVVAGFLVVALAQVIWASLFLADALAMFTGYEPPPVFDEPPWWTAAYAFGYYEGLISVSVVMWLIAYAIRRVAKSMASGRPA